MARVVRFPPGDEVDVLDEEFLYHLKRGGEHLARGEPEAARTALSRASDMRPGDAKVLGLLGQACYRMGRYGEAAEAYGRLVEETPAEAGAQVNLGLALLKAGRAADAITHLERALDLSPEHRRAMGYLGLAWLEQGNVARARSWFERGGREQMVARCDALLQGAHPAERHRKPVAPVPAPREDRADAWKVSGAGDGEPPADADDDAELAEALRILEHGADLVDRGAKVAAIGPANTPVAPEPAAPAFAAVEPPAVAPALSIVAPPVPAAPAAEATAPAPRVAAPPAPEPPRSPTPALTPPVAAALPAEPPRSPTPAPTPPVVAPLVPEPPRSPTPAAAPAGAFALEHGVRPGEGTFTPGPPLQVAVRGEVLVRLGGLVAVEGQVELASEARRVRGRGAQEPYGAGARAMQRARGDGRLLFDAAGRRHTVLELRGASAQFRDDAVVGFEGTLAFENGRLAAPDAPELELVRLAGEGAVLVASHGELASVEVAPGRPVRVAVRALVAWAGALTPRLIPLARPHADPDAVELVGEGRVLLDPGAPLA